MLNQLIESIDYLKNAETMVEITKGFSADKKYILDDRFLLRVFSKKDEASRRNEFECIDRLNSYSNYVPKTIDFGTVTELDLSYMILSYLPGRDGEEELPNLTETEQYDAGYTAGRELKKLHSLTAPSTTPVWFETKKKKSDKYLLELKAVPVEETLKQLLENYIHGHEHLMMNRPSTFQHDDYHPSNLLINEKGFSGVIDFQRMDWGDPLHDLTKIGFFAKRISVQFSKGVIDGYHEGTTVNNHFWALYSLYSAMHIVSALVWGRKLGIEQYDKLYSYSLEVLHDHDQFKRMIPSWYE